MKQNKLIVFSLALCFFLMAGGFVFAQEADGQQHEELDLNELEAEGAETAAVDSELQKDFIIVEPPRVHELNPQITSYSSDAQVLNGLYEGLFFLQSFNS